MMPKVLIADDHPLFRDAIRDVVERLFAARGWGLACHEAASLADVEKLTAAGEDLDLILLDLFMPGTQGLSQLVSLRSRMPAVPVVIISSLSDPATVRQAITCGAAGFIPKSSPKDLIATALDVVFDGGIYVPSEMIASDNAAERPAAGRAAAEEADSGALTPRQVDVLALVADGKSNKQIAFELSISEMTVKAHMTAILRKLGVASRAQAIVMFQRQLVPHP
jgi:DNA-binding NarL/FixJ family response regulator